MWHLVGFAMAFLFSAYTSFQNTSQCGPSSLTLKVWMDSPTQASTKGRTKPRFLVGLFSFGIHDTRLSNTMAIREQHRQYFEMLADPRICSLSWFLDDEGAPNGTMIIPKNDTSHCEFIYTFVAGFKNRFQRNWPARTVTLHQLHQLSIEMHTTNTFNPTHKIRTSPFWTFRKTWMKESHKLGSTTPP